jgi:predicted Zn-dependent peptidase
VRLFLDGRHRDLSNVLKKRMDEAVEDLRFEQAANLRDLISTVEELEQKQKMAAAEGDDATSSPYYAEPPLVAVNLFHMRNGHIVDRREFFFEDQIEFNPAELVEALIKQVYLNQQYIPGLIHVPYRSRTWMTSPTSSPSGAAERSRSTRPSAAKRSRCSRWPRPTRSTATTRGSGHEAVHADDPGNLQDLLSLPEPPRRIECFDISHIQGTDKVRSMVVWEDGKMKKSDYRKFIIRTVEGNDDFASMREVVGRRYSRLKEDGEPFPSIILIDGGIGQLHAAQDALEAIGVINQPVASIAKREEWIYVLGQEQDPIVLDKFSPVLHLIQQIRDEAHRFAVTFHRTRRNATRLTSELRDIPGVGDKTLTKLLREFGSLERVKEAAEPDLARIVGAAQARKVGRISSAAIERRLGASKLVKRMFLKKIGLLVAVVPILLQAQNLQEVEKRVTEFTLPNGMKWIVYERHQAPVVAFNAFVNAGAVDDPAGQSSMAHMFEHMIGKGTTTVGTTDWAAEQKALARIEQVYDRLEQEQHKGAAADKAKLKQLEAELKDAIESANAFTQPNEFTRVIEEQGGVGFNAGTAQDYTTYFYSLPSNKTELWFLLTSEWFKRPVFREFYKERDVVREERRMRVESSTQGKLMEILMATAFMAHPYRTFIGWASEIENLRAKDADAFYQKYYAPGNITMAVVGDVSPAEIRKLAEKYFGGIPARPMPPPVTVREPEQEGEKRAVLESPSQPLLIVGYKRPNQNHPDDPVFDVIAGVLSSGRTGLLYKDLVRDKRIALAAQAAPTFPAGKYDNLFILFNVPQAGHSVEENEKAMDAVVERLKTEKVDAATLDRVKTKVRAGLVRQLDSNTGLASELPQYETFYGDWRVMFTRLQDFERSPPMMSSAWQSSTLPTAIEPWSTP